MNTENRIGYLEEFFVPATNKFLGGRRLKTLPENRVAGYQGQQLITVTEDIVLDHNYKPKTLRAKGQQVVSMIIALHGKKIWSLNETYANCIANNNNATAASSDKTGSLATSITIDN